MWQCARCSPNSLLWVWSTLNSNNAKRFICELAACPRAEQIPCSCIELKGQKLASMLFASGMSLGLWASLAPKFMYGCIFKLVLVMSCAIIKIFI